MVKLPWVQHQTRLSPLTVKRAAPARAASSPTTISHSKLAPVVASEVIGAVEAGVVPGAGVQRSR